MYVSGSWSCGRRRPRDSRCRRGSRCRGRSRWIRQILTETRRDVRPGRGSGARKRFTELLFGDLAQHCAPQVPVTVQVAHVRIQSSPEMSAFSWPGSTPTTVPCPGADGFSFCGRKFPLLNALRLGALVGGGPPGAAGAAYCPNSAPGLRSIPSGTPILPGAAWVPVCPRTDSPCGPSGAPTSGTSGPAGGGGSTAGAGAATAGAPGTSGGAGSAAARAAIAFLTAYVPSGFSLMPSCFAFTAPRQTALVTP